MFTVLPKKEKEKKTHKVASFSHIYTYYSLTKRKLKQCITCCTFSFWPYVFKVTNTDFVLCSRSLERIGNMITTTDIQFGFNELILLIGHVYIFA